MRRFDVCNGDADGLRAVLQACIDVDAHECTSLLMDRLLDGRFRPWALVSAYGDKLGAVADALAAGLGLDDAEREQLRRLGEGINYNTYGDAADEFCRRFGGSGRAGAAGIDRLPDSELPRFIAELSAARWGG